MGQQQPVTDNKRFGKYLRKIREERRLSLDAVEEMSLGLPERVTKSHLSRIENGQAIPSFPRMFTLSQIYGVPVSLMAERFELCLKAKLYPAEAKKESIEEVAKHADRLRVSGRHVEALLLYESLIQRQTETSPTERTHWVTDIRSRLISCLIMLARYVTAKEECEAMLSSSELSPRQRVSVLQNFAICCYRLGRFTVALMAIDKAEVELRELPGAGDLAASLLMLQGNLFAYSDRFAEAMKSYQQASARYDELSLPFEACRARLNVGACLIEQDRHSHARRVLRGVLQIAEASGYDRQKAFALSHLACLAYKEHDLDATEAYCLRSNQLARPREYVPILFRNCYYLWRIGKERKDERAVRSNERTLRTYLSRIERRMPEADEFRAHLGGDDDE